MEPNSVTITSSGRISRPVVRLYDDIASTPTRPSKARTIEDCILCNEQTVRTYVTSCCHRTVCGQCLAWYVPYLSLGEGPSGGCTCKHGTIWDIVRKFAAANRGRINTRPLL